MKRTIIIIDKKTKEQIKISWPDAIMYYEGHTSFEEIKNKYSGEENEDKKSKF